MDIVNILAIETSCDDTSVAVLQNNVVKSNIIANQDVHRTYGGVVPELASRAHQQNIIPVVDHAIQHANIHKNNIHAIAYTRGPGLLGSLMIGGAFTKSMALSLGVPMIEVDHLDAHIFALFLDMPDKKFPHPTFPFIALLISGGHTRIAIVRDFLDVEYIGDTIDDAAGEAFDKAAKIMGLSYPGGPEIDKLAKTGDPYRFKFNKPNISGHNFSFSGLKTSFLYFVRDELKKDQNFISNSINDLCASIQHIIVEILKEKIDKVINETGIKQVGVVGGVSANSYLKVIFNNWASERNVDMFYPSIGFSTDNAAMIGMVGFLKYKNGAFAKLIHAPYSDSSKK